MPLLFCANSSKCGRRGLFFETEDLKEQLAQVQKAKVGAVWVSAIKMRSAQIQALNDLMI